MEARLLNRHPARGLLGAYGPNIVAYRGVVSLERRVLFVSGVRRMARVDANWLFNSAVYSGAPGNQCKPCPKEREGRQMICMLEERAMREASGPVCVCLLGVPCLFGCHHPQILMPGWWARHASSWQCLAFCSLYFTLGSLDRLSAI